MVNEPRCNALDLADALMWLADEAESDFLGRLSLAIKDLGDVDVTLVNSGASVWLVGAEKEASDVPDPGDGFP